MGILNLDKLQQKKAECSAAIMEAMKTQNDAALDKALGDFASFLGDTLAAEADQRNGGAIDTVVLAARGIRQLTQKETNFYQKFISAAKATDVKMAISNINEAIPVTVIDAVLEDVRKSHPLLDRINLRNGTMFTRYLYNKSGKPTVVWGEINSAITTSLMQISVTLMYSLKSFRRLCTFRRICLISDPRGLTALCGSFLRNTFLSDLNPRSLTVTATRSISA